MNNQTLASEIISDLLATTKEVKINLVALEGEALSLARKIDEEVKNTIIHFKLRLIFA